MRFSSPSPGFARISPDAMGPTHHKLRTEGNRMDRRQFLRTAAAASATLSVPRLARSWATGSSADSGWRTFEVTTRVEVLNPSGVSMVWLPAAQLQTAPYQKTLGNEFHAEGGTAELVRYDDFGIVTAKYPDGSKPVLTLTCKVSTRNYTVDLGAAGQPAKSDSAEIEKCLKGTKVVPVDGIVKATADSITQGVQGDVAKARAIYDWIVVNTFRNPKTRGCGLGDIRYMLESKDLGGKCADLNALYVGLARAAGIPARHIYGLRVAPSQVGFKSLGLATDNATKGQHCRAEVFLKDYGWVPVDPADVRKVVLEEPPGNQPMDSEVVQKARQRLFGSWEMNWMAYNTGHDVALPGSKNPPINYFMYPQAETGGTRVDPFDADKFKYEISSKEVTAA
jgi:transglutaminase-like putative cysteine protease